jgi:hypothetical protein
LIAFSTLAG